MTKARARERAKARAAQKSKKRQSAEPASQIPGGRFDATANNIKGPGGNNNAGNFGGGARRGASRSK